MTGGWRFDMDKVLNEVFDLCDSGWGAAPRGTRLTHSSLTIPGVPRHDERLEV